MVADSPRYMAVKTGKMRAVKKWFNIVIEQEVSIYQTDILGNNEKFMRNEWWKVKRSPSVISTWLEPTP